MNNIIRLLLIGIYPLILLLSFLYLYHKNNYKIAIKKHFKHILINTLVFAFIGSISIYIFFKFEDTIYSYDYAGHWVRSLELNKLFFENPKEILNVVYNSMNYHDYSYLPALFGLGLSFFNSSYGYFCLMIFNYFLVPTIILLQIIYFTYTDKYPYLPLVSFIIFYPLYLTIFYGEVDCIGLFFILMIYMIIFIPKFGDIKISDFLLVNVYAFCAIFLRRWYLYPVVAIYLCLFIKYLHYCHFKPFNRNALVDFFKIISSGLVMLIIILVLFRPFFNSVLFNNFKEAYSYYDKGPGKILALLNFYSPVIILISLFGIFQVYRNNKFNIIYILILLLFPTISLWSVQSFEYHHYYMISPTIILLFMFGINNAFKKIHKFGGIILTIFLLIQPISIFFFSHNIPLMTTLHKHPEKIDFKQEIVDFAYYLNSIMPEDWQSAYMASGSTVFNGNLIRNSILPDLNMPNIDSGELDLRDGFPKNFQYIQYIIITDPILYLDEEQQHVYDIISNAIYSEPLFKDTYNLIYNEKVLDINVQVYEKISDITPEMKQYFYDQMISFYPDHEDFFKYILD